MSFAGAVKNSSYIILNRDDKLPEEAAEIMNHLIDQIRNKIVVYEGEGLSVTMTFGLCSCENAATLDDLIIEVDDLLYEGKKNGRNQLVVHEP